MFFVLAHVQMLNKAITLSQVRFDAVPQSVELIGVKRTVNTAPVDGVLAAGLANDEAVRR